MAHEHDIRYKKLFSDPELVRQLLETFVDEPFVKELNFESAVRIDKSFVTEHFAEKESDIIYRVKHRDNDIYIYLLIEFQSTVDRFMALRMLRYILELYDSLLADTHIKTLPSVFPLMLYNGEQKWTAPEEIADLIEHTIPIQFFPHFRYYKLSENEFDKNYLASIKNAVSALFYIENMSKAEISDNLDTIFTILKKEKPELIRSITLFIRNYFKTDSEINAAMTEKLTQEQEAKQMLAQTIEQWREELVEEGIEKGKLYGLTEGKREIARKLLHKGFSVEEVAEYTGLDIDDIKLLQ